MFRRPPVPAPVPMESVPAAPEPKPTRTPTLLAFQVEPVPETTIVPVPDVAVEMPPRHAGGCDTNGAVECRRKRSSRDDIQFAPAKNLKSSGGRGATSADRHNAGCLNERRTIGRCRQPVRRGVVGPVGRREPTGIGTARSGPRHGLRPGFARERKRNQRHPRPAARCALPIRAAGGAAGRKRHFALEFFGAFASYMVRSFLFEFRPATPEIFKTIGPHEPHDCIRCRSCDGVSAAFEPAAIVVLAISCCSVGSSQPPLHSAQVCQVLPTCDDKASPPTVPKHYRLSLFLRRPARQTPFPAQSRPLNRSARPRQDRPIESPHPRRRLEPSETESKNY